MARCRFVFMPFDFPGKRKRVRESRIGARLSYIIIFIYYYYLVNLLFFCYCHRIEFVGNEASGIKQGASVHLNSTQLKAQNHCFVTSIH